MLTLHFERRITDFRRYATAGLLLALGCSGADLSAESRAGHNLGLAGGQGNGGTGNTTGSTASAGSGGGGGAATTSTTGGSNSSGPPKWTDLYTNYFGPGTSGNCTSCHNTGTSPAFSSAATLCATLKTWGYIGSGSATLQDLLTWFGGAGNMPLGGGSGPTNAVQDITAWQNAGASCP